MIQAHVPERFQGGIARYLLAGIPPGGFLIAVLKGDLFAAINRADAETLVELPGIACWVYQNLPIHCYGNIERVVDWWRADGSRGLAASDVRMREELEQLVGGWLEL